MGVRNVILPQLLGSVVGKAKRTLHPLRYEMVTARQDSVILAIVVSTGSH